MTQTPNPVPPPAAAPAPPAAAVPPAAAPAPAAAPPAAAPAVTSQAAQAPPQAAQAAHFSPFSNADEEQVVTRANLQNGRYTVVLGNFKLQVSQNKKNGTQGDQFGVLEATVLRDHSPDGSGSQPGCRADIVKFLKRGFYQTFKPILAAIMGVEDPNAIRQQQFDALMSVPNALNGICIDITKGTGTTDKGEFTTYDDIVALSDEDADRLVSSIPELQRFRPVGARQGWQPAAVYLGWQG